MQLQEQQIIQSCQKSNLEEFAKLYDGYVKKIYRFVYYKTHHKETAEDITSQTFIKAMRNIKSFDSAKGTFQAWLFRIARNTVIDYYRVKKNLVNVEDVWSLGKNNTVLRDIDIKDKLSQVYEYLAKLSPLQREIVVLRVWQALSYKEIAQIVGKSPSACKMAFARSIKRLREDLILLNI